MGPTRHGQGLVKEQEARLKMVDKSFSPVEPAIQKPHVVELLVVVGKKFNYRNRIRLALSCPGRADGFKDLRHSLF